MKKLLLLLPLLLLSISAGVLADLRWTVRFDQSFIEANEGKQAEYKLKLLGQAGVRHYILPILFNVKNVAGKNKYYYGLHGGVKHGAKNVRYVNVTPIDNLNGGVELVWIHHIKGSGPRCVDKLEVEAISGSLKGQEAKSSEAKRLGCYSQTWVVKVENDQLKIDREKKD